MATDERRDRHDDATSFEVDRHVDEQPPREDLIDPEDIDPVDAEEAGLDLHEIDAPARTGDPERLPDTEELPESQGDDIIDSELLAEDEVDRPPMHDEPHIGEEEEEEE